MNKLFRLSFFIVFTTFSCKNEDLQKEVKQIQTDHSIATFKFRTESHQAKIEQLIKSEHFNTFYKLLSEENEKYFDGITFTKMINRQNLPESIEITQQNATEILAKHYKDPLAQVIFINDLQRQTKAILENEKWLVGESNDSRSEILKDALSILASKKRGNHNNLRALDCGWNCNVSFNNTLDMADTILGVGVLACVMGTEGFGYFACIAAAAYAYDFAWEIAINNLATCFQGCGY